MFELKDVLRDFTQHFSKKVAFLNKDPSQLRSVLTDINALVITNSRQISTLNDPAQAAEKIRALTHLENLQRFLIKKIIALHQINNDTSFDSIISILNKYLTVFQTQLEASTAIASFGTKTAQAEFA